MVEGVNRQWTLAARPVGFPKESDFKLVESPVETPEKGEVLLKAEWLSLDPYMRGRMNSGSAGASGVETGGVMLGGVVGRVVDSRAAGFSPGDFALAATGWQEYGIAHVSSLRKLDPAQAPLSTAVGVAGMPGLTAYFGALDVCQPRPGDTFVVSAASGAVGAVAGQIALMAGCKVVGVAGTDEKIDYIVDELGFDGGINYKTQDVQTRLAEECPSGIDCYFDNVGGAVTDAVLDNLAAGARVAICGQISQYNLAAPEMGPRNLRSLLGNRARMQGFTVNNYAHRFPEGLARLTSWIRSGRLKYREHVVEGFEEMPRAFIGLLHGENFGKLLIKTAE